MAEPEINPFRFGALALDRAFADRESEVAALVSDMRNGQDVVVFAPRRYGKSSLVWRASQELISQGVLIAQVDLMTTPTKERLAEKLAAAIYENIASALDRVRERALAPFRGLRIQPTVTVNEDGSFSFSFGAAQAPEDLDATLERLLALPAELGAARGRRVALVMDEFQEAVAIDADLPRLLRAVFQQQPEIAHVYLGSRRHVMERIFNDENEPFWRSAKPVELGRIAPAAFAGFIEDRFAATGKAIEPDTAAELTQLTGGHPYATQELCYFLWEESPPAAHRRPGRAPRGAGGRVALRARPLHAALGPRLGHSEAAPGGARGRAAGPPVHGRLSTQAQPAVGVEPPAGRAGPGRPRDRRDAGRRLRDRRAVPRRVDPREHVLTASAPPRATV